MDEVDIILEKIDRGVDVNEVRRDIVALLADALQRVRNNLGYWEKAHLAHAIAELAWNVRSRQQPTTSWLRLCLVDLEKALVPADQRNENYTPRDELLDAITFEQLAGDLEVVRREADDAE